MYEKPIYQSKTVWFNVFATMAEMFAISQGIVAPEVVPYMVAAHGIANVILRVWFTDTKLTLPPDYVGER